MSNSTKKNDGIQHQKELKHFLQRRMHGSISGMLLGNLVMLKQLKKCQKSESIINKHRCWDTSFLFVCFDEQAPVFTF